MWPIATVISPSVLKFNHLLTQCGQSALLYAGWSGHSEVVKLLLAAGAKDIPDKVNQLLDTLIEGSPYSPISQVQRRYDSVTSQTCSHCNQ